jgi:hypothetical protein
MGEVNPTNPNNSDANATVAPEQTTNMPTGDQLQPPAAAPAPAPRPPFIVDPGSAGTSVTSKNPHLHGLVTSVLSAMAGRPPQTYSVDASGKLVGTPVRESTGDKVRRIFGAMGEGLSAGSQVEPRKSGLANILAGAGAGFGAEQTKEKSEDLLKRKQAEDEFEKEQQAMLHKHEIARQNALTLSTYFANKKAANDMNPVFGQNESLYNAVRSSPELGGHATEMSDTQVEQEEKKDSNFTQTHIIKPLGWAPEMDADGKQVMGTDAEGNPVPKFFMRMAVIDGTKDGKVQVTPEMAADLKQYGPMARIPNAETIKAGDAYSLQELIPVMNKVDEQRKAVLEGWQHSELGWVEDPQHPGKEIPVETNKTIPPNMPGRTRPLTVKPMALEAEEGKTALEKAQAFEAAAKGKEALANATLTAQLAILGNDKNSIPAYMDAISKLPQSSQAILRNVPPAQQLALLKVANADADLNKVFPTRTTKGSGQLDAAHATTLVSLLNPKWTEGLFQTKATAAKSFADGEDGKAIQSFNQFFVHADDARMASERLQRTNSPWLNVPILTIKTQAMGQPGVPSLMAAIQQARSEWQTFIKNGHAADLADTEQSRQILSDKSSPAQVLDALKEMGKGGIGRLDQIDAKWRRTWGGHYQGLISSSGRDAINNLGLGDMIKDYPVEGQMPMFGVQPPADAKMPTGPDATTHVFDSKAWAAANPGKDVNAAIAAAKAQNYEIK